MAHSSSSPPVRLACLGDSLTRGDGLHELADRYRVPSSRCMSAARPSWCALRERGNYPALLQRMLGTRWLVRNFGHGGATACNATALPYLQTRELAAAAAFRPHVVALMLGTNDAKTQHFERGPCAAGGSGAGLRAGLAAIVAALRPPRLLLVLEPPPAAAEEVLGVLRRLQPAVTAVLESFVASRRNRACGRSGAARLVAPRWSALAPHSFSSDRLHLRANGSAALACAVHSALRRCGLLRHAQRRRRRRRWRRRGGGDAGGGAEGDGNSTVGAGQGCCSHGACATDSGLGDTPLLLTGLPCALAERAEATSLCAG